jgi:hypothetical protein
MPRECHGINKHVEASCLGGMDACFKEFIFDGTTKDVKRCWGESIWSEVVKKLGISSSVLALR